MEAYPGYVQNGHSGRASGLRDVLWGEDWGSGESEHRRGRRCHTSMVMCTPFRDEVGYTGREGLDRRNRKTNAHHGGTETRRTAKDRRSERQNLTIWRESGDRT